MPTTPDHPLARSFLRNAHWADTTTARATWTYNHWLAWLDQRHTKLVDATRDDCETWLEQREVDGVAPATRQVDWRMLKALYTWLYEEGECDSNPMSRVKAPKVSETPVAVLEEADYHRLLATCDRRREDGRRDEAILSLLWWSGLRRSELCNLDLDAVNFDSGMLTIGSRTFATKSRKIRRVPLAAHTISALDRYLRNRGEEPGPLFLSQHGDTHTERRLKPNGITQMLRRRADRAGLGRNVGAHEFRRAMAVRGRRAGASDLSMMAIGGWSSTAMLGRYTRMQREELAAEEFHRLIDTSQASTRRRGRRVNRGGGR